MICPHCNKKMKPMGTVDENWRFYKCSCGYEAAKHIHKRSARFLVSTTKSKEGVEE